MPWLKSLGSERGEAGVLVPLCGEHCQHEYTKLPSLTGKLKS